MTGYTQSHNQTMRHQDWTVNWQADFKVRSTAVLLNARLIFSEDAYRDSTIWNKKSDLGLTLGYAEKVVVIRDETQKYKSRVFGPSAALYFSTRLGKKWSAISFLRADIQLWHEEKYKGSRVVSREKIYKTENVLGNVLEHPYFPYQLNPGITFLYKNWLNIYFEYPLGDFVDLSRSGSFTSQHPFFDFDDFNIQNRFIFGIGLWLGPTFNSYQVPWVKKKDKHWKKGV